MAYNRRKRKVKKNIPEAQAHINSTYNNTVVSITDKDGKVVTNTAFISDKTIIIDLNHTLYLFSHSLLFLNTSFRIPSTVNAIIKITCGNITKKYWRDRQC